MAKQETSSNSLTFERYGMLMEGYDIQYKDIRICDLTWGDIEGFDDEELGDIAGLVLCVADDLFGDKEAEMLESGEIDSFAGAKMHSYVDTDEEDFIDTGMVAVDEDGIFIWGVNVEHDEDGEFSAYFLNFRRDEYLYRYVDDEESDEPSILAMEKFTD